MGKLKEYIIESIECDGKWYPTIYRRTIKATCLEGALEAVISDLGYYDLDDIERLKEDCVEEFGCKKGSNELLALAYNQLLDEQYARERILRGYLNKRKVFDIVITQEE